MPRSSRIGVHALVLRTPALEGGNRRAINISESEAVHEAAFVALVRAAIATNGKRG